MLKIIVTGPECSGKTTLCKVLSEHFKISFTEEYAREYLTSIGKNYQKNDLLKIAKGQLENEQITTNNHRLSLYDTDLITIKIWNNYKYGRCDKWILEQIKKQKSEERFYFLCKPDIPWKADPLRETPTNRLKLFKIYKKELEKLGHGYFVVEGENRLEDSISKISNLIS